METEQAIFFDPFGAEQTGFNPDASLEQLMVRYEQGKIDHDYSVDTFVADTQALMMDAAFVEDFGAVERIANQMQAMCQHDHALRDAVTSLEQNAGESEHKHDHEDEKEEPHDKQSCHDCLKGKYCTKK